MRTTDFKDKQVTTGLSRFQSDDDFSGDFSHNSSSLPNNINLMDHFEFASASSQRAGDSNAALISVIDRKLKEHVDNVLYAVEGISARLSQLETRTHRLESSIDDLKETVEQNQGRADGKLRELENILREVQGGVHDLRDKQEIAEAQVRLAALQASKNDKGSETRNNSVEMKVAPETLPYAHQQTQKPHPGPVACPQQLSAPPNSVSQIPSYQSPPQPLPTETTPQLSAQMPQSQFYSVQQPEPYYPPPSQASEIMHQQHHMHSTQHFPPQPSAQHSAQHFPPQPSTQPFPPQPSTQHLPSQPSTQHFLPQPSTQHLPSQPSTQHSPSQPSTQHLPPQPSTQHLVQHQPYGSAPQPPQTYHPEENSYMPPQNYPPNAYNPSQLPRASQAQQPYVGSAQQVHNQPSSGSFSELSSAYSQPPEYSNSGSMYPYSGSSTHFRGSTMKSPQIPEPYSASAGLNNHSQLPTAKLLPQAIPTAHILPETLPTASTVDDGSSSGGTRSKVPFDDVVENVVAMGFRRDLVRATVRKMKENGQSVNLNTVLDKVMNDEEGQTHSGRFG